MNLDKVIIAGGAGFIGSHLVKRLLEKKYDVGLIKREKTNIDKIKEYLKDLTVFNADIKDSEAVLPIFSEFKPNIVVNLAMFYTVEHKPEDINQMIDTNIKGTLNLLEASKQGKIKLFINTSTSFVYKEKKDKLKEEDELNPLNLYALTKINSEQLCSFYSEKYKLNAVTLRIFPPYGPGDNPRRLIPFVIKSLDNDEELKLTSGLQKWDYTYVEDIADAYMKVIAHELYNGHKIINVGASNPVSIREIVGDIKSIMKKNTNIEWGAIPHRENEVWYCCADINKAKIYFGWEPKTDIKQGLEKTVKWYMKKK